MAGDWIKMQANLPDKPEVWHVSGITGIDPDAVVGKLLRVWAWFDAHTVDGNAVGVSFPLIDRIAGVAGFGEALHLAGWLEHTSNGISLPNFDRHNGKSAKSRALTNERVAKNRAKGNAACNADTVTKSVTREEKRREEVNTPQPPRGFEEFWSEWPQNTRKAAKAQCAAKWAKQGCDENPEAVLAALRAAKASDEWKKSDGQYIPAPLVWLNQARWEAFAGMAGDLKPGTPEYFAQHRRASWWQEAGFESVEDAHNNRCWHGNASEFINGTRGEP